MKIQYIILILLVVIGPIKASQENIRLPSDKECFNFYKGKFKSFVQNRADSTILINNGSFSFLYDEKSESYKIKAIFQIVGRCTYMYRIVEIDDPTKSENEKKHMFSFPIIESIYRIEGNKAYYKGIGCDCAGYYEKLE